MRLKRSPCIGDGDFIQQQDTTSTTSTTPDVYPMNSNTHPIGDDHQLLQLYWDTTWTQKHEDKVLQSWASRTFSATCYKFTLQNDPETRSKTGPLYSFLENWQLHTMYNKSQKLLLGIEDIRPCVILTGDDFMFTPPPIKETRVYQQQRMDYVDDDDEEEEDNDNEKGDTNDEPSWIMYQPASPLHVVNMTDADYDDDDDYEEEEEEEDDDDDDDDDQPIMILGREDAYNLTEWYPTVEPDIPKQQHNSNNDFTHAIHQPDNLTPRVTWRQWLQHGLFFVSQRIVEVAYLVAELAESMATEPSTTTTIRKPNRRRMTQLSTKGGRYVVHLFRVWRVFFLGVETLLHQLSPLDTSPKIPLLILK